jgi:hypothetical protein
VTTPAASRGTRGAIVWAFAGFQPEAPFQALGRDGEVLTFATAGELAEAVREGRLQTASSFLVGAKLRPVVLLQERPRGVLPEFAGLKLARFTKRDPREQQRIRDGKERALLYLPHDERKYGLKQENAVDLNSLVRLHRSTLVTRPVGYLDEHELDVLGRRLAECLDIDLTPAIRQGVIERWEQLVAAQQRRTPNP